MPAEWQRHASTWMAWPHDDEQWIGMLEPVRREFAEFVTAIAARERVNLLVADEESANDAKARLATGNVELHHVPHQDLWLRDSGPTFLTRDDEVALVDWDFNGWGNKYPAELDNRIPEQLARILGNVTPFHPRLVMEGGALEVSGDGALLTTRQCLLAPTRNPGETEETLESALKAYLGVTCVIWLDEGLEGDHTDGHIDTITRFVDESTIVTAVCRDLADPNHDILARNLDLLHQARMPSGDRYRIVELPTPTGRTEFEGERLPLTYANFYIVNGAVLVPIYGAPEDDGALDILRPLFPGRDVVGLPARALITGGGAFHCVTQQQPDGRLWRRE